MRPIFYSITLGAVLLLSSCDTNGDYGNAEVEMQHLSIISEKGTLLAEFVFPADVALPSNVPFIEKDGQYRIMMTDAFAKKHEKHQTAASKAPAMVRGDFCVTTSYVVCERVTAVNTWGSGRQGRLDRNVSNPQSNTPYKGPVGCFASVSGDLDFMYVTAPLTGEADAISYYYDDQKVFITGIINTTDCEEDHEVLALFGELIAGSRMPIDAGSRLDLIF